MPNNSETGKTFFLTVSPDNDGEPTWRRQHMGEQVLARGYFAPNADVTSDKEVTPMILEINPELPAASRVQMEKDFTEQGAMVVTPVEFRPEFFDEAYAQWILAIANEAENESEPVELAPIA